MTVGISFPVSTHPPSIYSPQTPDQPHPLLQYIFTLSENHKPTKSLLISCLKSTSLISHAQSIHAHIIKFGLASDRFVGTSLVAFYSSFGHMISMRKVFDGMLKKDAVLYTALVTGYARNGDIRNARKVFEEMPERDVVAWNAMLSGLVRCGQPENALEFFREMQICDVKPNAVTLVVALSACSEIGCLALGEWIHGYVDRNVHVERSTTLKNAIVHMYAKCGRLGRAFCFFLEIEPKNLESWNTMLTGLAVHGCSVASISLFSQMIKIGVAPDKITCLGLLMACSHSGNVEFARSFLNRMKRTYNIEPRQEHYGCMVDVLSRSGHLKEAHSLLKSTSFPNEYMWGALLGGSCVHHNYELGLEAAKALVELQPWDESRYITMINLYLVTGRSNDATKVRKKMVELGIKKTSGSSVIEVDEVAHEFVAGDRSHCHTKEIYAMVDRITGNLEWHACCYQEIITESDAFYVLQNYAN